MLVGRRGSGKSSLVNAIFGQQVAEVGHTKAQTGRGRWWVFQGDLGSIEILDTRGLQEGSNPESEDDKKNALESIVASIGT
jgi:predicted GTPase